MIGSPPQMIISPPVQTAECPTRALGALVWETAFHLSLTGSYPAPSTERGTVLPEPPQTIISVPVQTAVCAPLAEGAFSTDVTFQESAFGSYRPPVSVGSSYGFPPQMTISLPVHTAV